MKRYCCCARPSLYEQMVSFVLMVAALFLLLNFLLAVGACAAIVYGVWKGLFIETGNAVSWGEPCPTGL